MSKATVTITDADGNELELPARFEVCPRCAGEGSHVNPSIDGNGLSAEDFADDPDFAEDYMSGVYDVICEQCSGSRVIAVVDPAKLSPDQQAEYARWLLAKAEDQRDYDSERRLRQMEGRE